MNDKARINMFHAEHYLEDAVARSLADDPYSPAQAMSYGTEAMILAFDAICHAVGVAAAKRHDQAPRILRELIAREKLPPGAAPLRQAFERALSHRAAFHYHAELASKAEARRFLRDVEAFVEFARQVVGR